MDKRYGILIVSVTILVLCFVGTASAANWSVDCSGGANFTGIQDAINNATDGDTIIVHSGVYYENVVVNKSVTLKGIGYPVVDASRVRSAITLTADGITLEGFNVTNSGSSWYDAGVKVISSNNNNITGNNASNNNWNGIYLVDSSNNNRITGNNVSSNNRDGIRLSSSSNNTITGNNVSNNNDDGISLEDCSNNTIIGNNVSNNNGRGISLEDCSNNTIIGNNVSNNNWQGIYLFDSCNNNTITGNNVSNNDYGIYLRYSSNNNIHPNNFINNTDNVCSYTSTTIWNSPLEMSYTYDGNAYTNYVGNYWADYGGTDAKGDGIGDTHYSIDSDSDECDLYPLMNPFENYILTTSAPA